MVTGAVKNKVDKIWTDLWAGGITNPLTVIEQLTYLMFIRSLDEQELEREQYENLGIPQEHIFPASEIGQRMRWSHFRHMDARAMFEILSKYVFPAVKNMKNGKLPDFDADTGEMLELPADPDSGAADETAFARYMSDAMFLIPTPQALERLVTGLEDLYTDPELKNQDMQGDLYEYMLSKLSTAGQNGQFRTPRHIREMMVELLQPTPDDTICESNMQILIQFSDCLAA